MTQSNEKLTEQEKIELKKLLLSTAIYDKEPTVGMVNELGAMAEVLWTLYPQNREQHLRQQRIYQRIAQLLEKADASPR